MKARCTECKKEYDLKQPLRKGCAECNGKMLYIAEDFKGIWFSPRFALLRVKYIVENFGLEKLIKKSKFKHEREAWVTAIWALGLSLASERTYWIEVETEDSTPDNYAFYIEQINGNNHKQTHAIEVADWEEHADHILTVISDKCKNQYPKFYTLLVNCRNLNKEVVLKELIDKLSEIEIPFGEIWTVEGKDEDLFVLTRIYPNLIQLKYSLKEALKKNSEQQDFTTFLQRNTGSEIMELGQLFMPWPTRD